MSERISQRMKTALYIGVFTVAMGFSQAYAAGIGGGIAIGAHTPMSTTTAIVPVRPAPSSPAVPVPMTPARPVPVTGSRITPFVHHPIVADATIHVDPPPPPRPMDPSGHLIMSSTDR